MYICFLKSTTDAMETTGICDMGLSPILMYGQYKDYPHE